MSHDLHSSPATEPSWPPSPTTPNLVESGRRSQTPLRWATSWTDDERDKSQESITETIIRTRRDKHKTSFPSYTASPTKSRLEDQYRHMKGLRDNKRNGKASQQRGGLHKMESFVMNSELTQELQRLSLQAEEYTISPDLAEEIEQQQQEDLEDDALIDYINHRDQLDQELDSMIAELSLN